MEADTSNPPGNEARAIAVGVKRLKEWGIPYEVLEFAPGRENLIATLKGTGELPPILLLAHVDVVPAAGQTWATDPHKVVEKDGFLYGRGVMDDLGMAVINMEVLGQLKKSGVKLKRDIIVAWTGDEESGGAGIKFVLDKRPELLHAEYALNEGGGLVLAKNGKLFAANVQTAEKNYQDFDITVSGTIGHSSLPNSDNAIYHLSRALAGIEKLKFRPHLSKTTREYFEARAKMEGKKLASTLREIAKIKGTIPEKLMKGLEANPILLAMVHTTCVTTLVKGGMRVNALPADASANVNCRILPDESLETVQAALQKATGSDKVKVSTGPRFGFAGESLQNADLTKAIQKAIAKVYPGQENTPVIPTMVLGATDGRHLRAEVLSIFSTTR